jgi:hypothetical protein
MPFGRTADEPSRAQLAVPLKPLKTNSSPVAKASGRRKRMAEAKPLENIIEQMQQRCDP